MIPTELFDPIIAHVRQQVLADVTQALGGATATAERPRARRRSTAAAPAAVLAHVRAHPKSSVSEIRDAIGADPKAALLELRKSGDVRTIGNRRGVKYLPAKAKR